VVGEREVAGVELLLDLPPGRCGGLGGEGGQAGVGDDGAGRVDRRAEGVEVDHRRDRLRVSSGDEVGCAPGGGLLHAEGHKFDRPQRPQARPGAGHAEQGGEAGGVVGGAGAFELGVVVGADDDAGGA
jgi:hypothetical protein